MIRRENLVFLWNLSASLASRFKHSTIRAWRSLRPKPEGVGPYGSDALFAPSSYQLTSTNKVSCFLPCLQTSGNFHQDSFSFAETGPKTYKHGNEIMCFWLMSLFYLRMYHLMKQYIFASTRVVFSSWPSEITSGSVSQNLLKLATKRIQ